MGGLRRPTLERVRRWALAVLTVELAVLAGTGTWLWFGYLPGPVSPWVNVLAIHGATAAERIRWAHRAVGGLMVITALVTAAVLVVQASRRWRGSERRRVGAFVGPLLFVVTLGASFTGFLLPWDQLALWAVTAGTSLDGFRIIWHDEVRFVLLGGAEVAPGTVRTWTVVHLALSAVIVPVAIVAAWAPRPSAVGPPRSNAPAVPEHVDPTDISHSAGTDQLKH